MRSANATRSYRITPRYWAGWCQGRYGQPLRLPVPTAAVVQFVVDHVARDSAAGRAWKLPPALDQTLIAAGLKVARARGGWPPLPAGVAMLSTAHQRLHPSNPVEAIEVSQLPAGARRAASGEREGRPDPGDLHALLATCGDDLAGVRDRALLLLAFANGGRRRSEVAAATVAQLHALPQSGFAYYLDQGKTLQDGPRVGDSPDKPLVGAATTALQARAH